MSGDGIDAVDDAILIRRTLSGETEAFSQLVDRYRPSVFAFAASRGLPPSDADDAAQDAFIRAFRHLGTLKSYDRFSAWLLQIAAHACNDVDARRKRSNRNETPASEPLETAVARDVPPLDAISASDAASGIADALQRLDDDHRAVLIMRFIEGKNATQIARANGESPGTVRSRIHYALEKLRRLLDNDR